MTAGAKPEPRRLLVVDDEEAVLSSIGSHMRALGWRVFYAASAEEAILVAAREKPSVILLDNVLPGMTGVQALREFNRLSAVPVVMMSKNVDQEREKDFLLCGARAVLSKPLDLSALESRLAGVVPA